MSVKLKAALPKGEANGLPSVADKMADNPGDLVTAVVLLRVKNVTTNYSDDDDPRTVHLGIVAMEVLTDSMDTSAAKALLAGRYENRTGLAALPFGSISDIELGGDNEPGDATPIGEPEDPDHDD